mmetsp:Transcript_5242/g.3960  ORF Transcript_5242/g.3960 Transcript_5242/m.3960 type:complete len:104 (-) Transcript_5242:67-378(-)
MYLCLVFYILVWSMFIIFIGFFSFHIYLLTHGYTTIEFCEKRRKTSKIFQNSPYDMGLLRNIQLVLGDSPWLWFAPIDTKPKENKETQGVFFELRQDVKDYLE